MPIGRKILEESNPILDMYRHPDMKKRRDILRKTLDAFSKPNVMEQYHLLASQNLTRWKSKKYKTNIHNKIQVYSGDWGEVAHMLTKKYGRIFAVLNLE